MTNNIICKGLLSKTDKRLHIPGHLFDQMYNATQLCKVEMSMLGLLRVDPFGLVLDSLFIPPQIVGDSHAQINPEMVGNINTMLFTSGKVKVGDDTNFLRFSWHSHVNMPAKMSFPDRENSSSFGGQGTKFDTPWWISMVMNRVGDYEVIYDMFQPVREVIDITDRVVTGDPMFSYPELVAEITKNVCKGKQTFIGGGTQGDG